MTFLVFLVLSTFFWILQTVYEDANGNFDVQVIIKDMPSNAVFTTAIPSEIKVTVHDKSISLMRYYYQNTLNTLELDFNRYADHDGNFRVSGAELHSLLQTDLNGTTQISTISPALIDARFALSKGRRIPIVYQGEYTSAMQFRCEEAKLSPDSVTVYAPEYILDTLKCLYTHRKNFSELTDSIKETINIDLPLGVKAVPNQAQLSIAVEEYVEKTFKQVKLHVANVPDSTLLKLFPTSVQISCNVNISQYKKISAEDFVLYVSYNDIINQQQKHLPIKIENYPLEATHIRLQPDSVEYIIEEFH